MNLESQAKPHSALYFGESRNYWWNQDYVALLAKRANLGKAKDVLDVGCGVGHWGRVLTPWLHDEFKLFGVDREQEWADKAQTWVDNNIKERKLRDRFSYQVATAEQLPFADNTFDLVTCQTVLIHVSSASDVITEMLRVLKPGGNLLLVEPNNLASQFAPLIASPDFSVEDVLEIMRLQMICEKGKVHLGCGYNSIGEQLPALLNREEIAQVQVFQTDKAFKISKHHPEKDHEIVMNELKRFDQEQVWLWPKDETERYFIAGGGKVHDFPVLWELAMQTQMTRNEALENGTLALSGTNATFVAIAHKF